MMNNKISLPGASPRLVPAAPELTRRAEGRSPWTGRIKSAPGHFLIPAMMVLVVSSVWAQEPPTPAKEAEQMKAVPDMDHSQMDHSKMDHSKMDHGATPPPDPATLSDPGADSGMNHGSMQGGSAPPDARDPHAYSGGYTLDPARPLRMADEHNFHSLLVDRFERVHTRENSSTEYDLQAWFGRNYDRVVLKAEGEVDDGKIEDAHTELLWGHAVAAYWDTQVGVRYDSGKNPDRKWLAFGIQGLAPYWFEVDATAYMGESGRTALRLEAEYELLLTQKLVLQPRIEANFYGKRDAQRELGSGLSDLALGLRLRYEIRREFAPYIGIERSGKFGGTADFARADGERTKETRLVAGLRFWF